MKGGLYPKLALDGIRKNKRMYIPYILTCIGMVMMYYIVSFLQYSDAISYVRGAEIVKETVGLGSWVIAIFSCIFLFYTNSFLIRRRKKEFGLYNILGMGKRNIGYILFWESVIIYVLSAGIGLFAGISFSKLAELGLVRLLESDVRYDMSVSVTAVLMTLAVFGAIFVLLLLNSLRQVRFSSAVSLIKSENAGEKPPRGNWFIALLGIIALGVAYYIAVTIDDPVTALLMFFVAVVLVIIGTYLIMIAGSVLFCRVLQKKKKYYYKANHFVSVSSMVYRMKRNGAGLASICILATMVLVMISSTASLYFGEEDSLMNRYPREIDVTLYFDDTDRFSDGTIPELRDKLLTVADRYGVQPKNIQDYRSITVGGLVDGTTIVTDATKVDQFGIEATSNVYQINIVPIEDYNRMMNADETLEDGEAMICTFRSEYTSDKIAFEDGKSFKIKKTVESFVGDGDAAMSVIPTMYIFVPDIDSAVEGIDALADYTGRRMITIVWKYNFDTSLDENGQINLYNDMRHEVSTLFDNTGNTDEVYGLDGGRVNGRQFERVDYYNTFGSLLYLAILLSIVFIFAAVLIIYYKQISEGYEDQSRFDIMQKVGMTKKEIRKSINSQLLTVFFLPLIGAGMHLAFAFPMVKLILLCFNLSNVDLFFAVTAISFAVFAIFYVLVYRITSNAYYNIVSGIKKE